MRVGWIVVVGLALAACTAEPGAIPQAETEAASRPIVGDYVITYVNEAPPVFGIEGTQATVTIDAERIHFQSQCVFDDWRYTREGEAISTGIWQASQEMCARALEPGEEAIITAIGAADTVRHVPRGLYLSGTGGTVQMRFVPGAADLAGRAVDLSGSWRVAALDGKAPADPIDLEADWHGVWWEPGCAGQGIAYTIAGDRFTAPPPGQPGAVCDIGFPPDLTAVWSALVAADTIAESTDGGVAITGGGRSVLLVRR